MNQKVERLVARYEDAREKLRREVETAIRALEEAKARLQDGEVPTPLHMPPESLWATYREARTLAETVEMVRGR